MASQSLRPAKPGTSLAVVCAGEARSTSFEIILIMAWKFDWFVKNCCAFCFLDAPVTPAQTSTAKSSPEWPLEIYRRQDPTQPLSSTSNNHSTTFENLRFLHGLETSDEDMRHQSSSAHGGSLHEQSAMGGDILSTGEMQLPLDFDL